MKSNQVIATAQEVESGKDWKFQLDELAATRSSVKFASARIDENEAKA